MPREQTVINFPKATYNFNFPLFSNCTSSTTRTPQYVHWQVAGASDLVIDGHGSTVNFSDLCLGLNLADVNRVTLRNFVFSWPNIQIASVATVIAVGGNADIGYTYDVEISMPAAARAPKMIAAATAWDKAADHWDLNHPNDDVSYGDGVGSGTPLSCSQDEVAGTTSSAPPINQNIIAADNLFETNSPQAVINVSSANDVLFFRDAIALVGPDPRGPRQLPSPFTMHRMCFSIRRGLMRISCAGRPALIQSWSNCRARHRSSRPLSRSPAKSRRLRTAWVL